MKCKAPTPYGNHSPPLSRPKVCPSSGSPWAPLPLSPLSTSYTNDTEVPNPSSLPRPLVRMPQQPNISSIDSILQRIDIPQPVNFFLDAHYGEVWTTR